MNDIFEEYKNKFVKKDEIIANLKLNNNEKEALRKNLERKTKKGEIFRAGRGVYGFFKKETYVPRPNEFTNRIVKGLKTNFKYLDYTITDTAFLSDFMNLQPFSTVRIIETIESAIEPIIFSLKKEDIEAYAVKDYSKIEMYIKNNVTVIIRPKMLTSPSPIKSEKIKFAGLEKILVDLISDENIFSQYQDIELENIYKNIIEKYVVNYSKLLKYATARNRKNECISFLETTKEYPKVRDLL